MTLEVKDLSEDERRSFEIFYSRKVDVDVTKEDRIVVEDAKK